MTFSNFIKKELFDQDMNAEQAFSFINGIISSSGYFKDKTIILKINISDISKLIKYLLNRLQIDSEILKKNKNWIKIKNSKIREEFDKKQPVFFFAGVFIGGGSMSDPKSTSYHLEIQFYYRNKAERIRNFLNKYQFRFQLIKRRKDWVIYLKKSENIADFLRFVQAQRSLMKFEEIRIKRNFRNNLNRHSNLDIYNQKKLSISSCKHLKNYDYIVKNNLLYFFKENELIFFKLKKDNPYSSLSELANKLKKNNIVKTRSGLNHWLIKLKKVFEEN